MSLLLLATSIMCVHTLHTCSDTRVVSNSAAPWTVALRLFAPWDSPGKNTGVDCPVLLQGGLPNPRTGPGSPVSPALAGGFFTTEPPLALK